MPPRLSEAIVFIVFERNMMNPKRCANNKPLFLEKPPFGGPTLKMIGFLLAFWFPVNTKKEVPLATDEPPEFVSLVFWVGGSPDVWRTSKQRLGRLLGLHRPADSQSQARGTAREIPQGQVYLGWSFSFLREPPNMARVV